MIWLADLTALSETTKGLNRFIKYIIADFINNLFITCYSNECD